QAVTDIMENNEITEARFAGIMAAVGSPFEVDTTPRQSHKSWLEKLATADFVSVRAVCRLDLDLVVNNIGYFDLLINDEATYTVAPYPDVLGPWTTN
ncbi:hypothetical protein FOC4_g10001650, partial [Fusarium odoratissimum]